MDNVAIIGGGLAGLVSSILLARAGVEVVVIERKSYPLQKVCGEYVSNEVVPFLKSNGLYPEQFQPSAISRFLLSSVSGKEASVALPLGGFGISRFRFDHFLYEKALASGVKFELNQQVEEVERNDDGFTTFFGNGQTLSSGLVVGAFGKRSKLDKQLDRSFIQKRSPFIGVKYHVKTDFADDTVALYNFPDGYCGLVKIEDEKYNLCYLSRRENLKQAGSIAAMEHEILGQNPVLKRILRESDFLLEKPEVINEISFERKETVKNGILMAGDAAGLITPLCGNGMAIAIHAAKLLAEIILSRKRSEGFDIPTIEKQYQKAWRRHFSQRLWAGRKTQNLFGAELTSGIGVRMVEKTPWLTRKIISFTHGRGF